MGIPDESAKSETPSGVRWRVLALLFATIALAHFNRISMSVAGNEQILKKVDGITETQLGWVYSAYLIIYTFAMTPGGWLIDRWGPRRSLMLLGFGSAGFVALTGAVGLAWSSAGMLVLGLFAVRGCLGVVSAPLHPSGARVVSFWFPKHTWAGINGITTAAACIGIASTYFLFGELMDVLGWPAAFMVAGGITAILALTWSAFVTDHPGQHPGVNPAERALIEEGQSAAPLPTDEATGLWDLLGNRSLILLTLSYSAVNYFEYLFFYWMEHYFNESLKLPTERSRLYSTICILAMGVGMFLGGGVADRLHRRYRRHGRRIVPVVGMTLSALLLGLGLVSTEPVWIVIWFALALAAIGATEGPAWTTAVELGGRHGGGTAAAICNTGGNAGGLLAPILTPVLALQFDWKIAVAAGGFYCLLGAVLWAWIHPPEATCRQE
jgi:MFS family permease